ncbi:MAG: hypothetical protein HQL60_03725 [Magnetococcales bacterium]|nr:hypothetical protein [Magnetococcales bacterium]
MQAVDAPENSPVEHEAGQDWLSVTDVSSNDQNSGNGLPEPEHENTHNDGLPDFEGMSNMETFQ